MAGVLTLVVGTPALAVPVRIAPAHAFVRGVSPVANSNSAKAPGVAMVVMGEEGLGGLDDSLHVWDAAGVDHAGALAWQTVGADTRFSVPLSSLSAGWYLAGSDVVSSDGHAVSAWWAFGVNARTAASSTKKIVLTNTDAPAGLPARMTVSVNGLRTGARKVISIATWGAVTNVRWVLKNGDAKVAGAWLDWGVTHDTKKKTDTATGVVPRGGTWTLVATVRAKSKAGWQVSTWTADVAIAP